MTGKTDVPDELVDIYVTRYHAYPGPEARLARRAALDGVLNVIETRVHRAFAAADEDDRDLNALTVPELTALVMTAIRGDQ